MSTPNQISTIVEQLGGWRFAAMTGASFFYEGDTRLTVKFKGSKAANIMYIDRVFCYQSRVYHGAVYASLADFSVAYSCVTSVKQQNEKALKDF